MKWLNISKIAAFLKINMYVNLIFDVILPQIRTKTKNGFHILDLIILQKSLKTNFSKKQKNKTKPKNIEKERNNIKL